MKLPSTAAGFNPKAPKTPPFSKGFCRKDNASIIATFVGSISQSLEEIQFERNNETPNNIEATIDAQLSTYITSIRQLRSI